MCVGMFMCVYMYVQALLRESLWVRVFEACQGQGSAHGSLGPSCLLPFSRAQRAAGSSHHWPLGPPLRAPSLQSVGVSCPSGPLCTQTLLLNPLLQALHDCSALFPPLSPIWDVPERLPHSRDSHELFIGTHERCQDWLEALVLTAGQPSPPALLCTCSLLGAAPAASTAAPTCGNAPE